MTTMEERMPRKAPPKIRPQSLSDYFEVLTKAVFKSGISWGVVEARWGGLRAAFEGFDPARVACFTPETVEELMRDARMMRSRSKIEATVDNAAEIVALDREHGGFRNYLRSHADFDEALSDLTSRFRHLGEAGAYFFLHVVGEPVPPHEEWAAARR
jgi:3-methyladenine DNA glycosylase Tag